MDGSAQAMRLRAPQPTRIGLLKRLNTPVPTAEARDSRTRRRAKQLLAPCRAQRSLGIAASRRRRRPQAGSPPCGSSTDTRLTRCCTGPSSRDASRIALDLGDHPDATADARELPRLRCPRGRELFSTSFVSDTSRKPSKSAWQRDRPCVSETRHSGERCRSMCRSLRTGLADWVARPQPVRRGSADNRFGSRRPASRARARSDARPPLRRPCAALGSARRLHVRRRALESRVASERDLSPAAIRRTGRADATDGGPRPRPASAVRRRHRSGERHDPLPLPRWVDRPAGQPCAPRGLRRAGAADLLHGRRAGTARRGRAGIRDER